MPRRKKTFGRRAPALSVSAPAVLCKTSSRPAKHNIWTGYLLKDVMEEHSLYNKPSQIYNGGVPLDPRTPNIVAQRKLDAESQGRRGKYILLIVLTRISTKMSVVCVLVPTMMMSWSSLAETGLCL